MERAAASCGALPYGFDTTTTTVIYYNSSARPFNSRLKWMKTIHKPPSKSADQRRLAILKVWWWWWWWWWSSWIRNSERIVS